MTIEPKIQQVSVKLNGNRAGNTHLLFSAPGEGFPALSVRLEEWNVLYGCLLEHGSASQRDLATQIQELDAERSIGFAGNRLAETVWKLHHAIVSPFGVRSALVRKQNRDELMTKRASQIISGFEGGEPLTASWGVEDLELWWLFESQLIKPISRQRGDEKWERGFLTRATLDRLPVEPFLSDIGYLFKWTAMQSGDDFLIAAIELDNFDGRPRALGAVFSNLELATTKIETTGNFGQCIALDDIKTVMRRIGGPDDLWVKFFSPLNPLLLNIADW